MKELKLKSIATQNELPGARDCVAIVFHDRDDSSATSTTIGHLQVKDFVYIFK